MVTFAQNILLKLYMRKYFSAYSPSMGELWLIMLALICVGGSMVSAGALVILSFIGDFDTGMLSMALYPLLFSVAIPFVLLRAKHSYLEKSRRGISLPKDDPPSFGSIHGVLFFGLLLLLTPTFILVTEPLSMWMKMPDFLKNLFGEVLNHGWISFLALGIMAPLLEEWFCRGIALKGLLKNGYTPASAIAWSAFMFGIMHMNPWQAIPAFLMGLLFGWIYWRTRSLWSVIFMHAVTNGLSVALTWAFPHLPEDASTLDVAGPRLYFWILTGALIITVLIIGTLHKKLAPSAPLFRKPLPPNGPSLLFN